MEIAGEAEESDSVLLAVAKARKTVITKEMTPNRENFTILAFIFLLYLTLKYNQSAGEWSRLIVLAISDVQGLVTSPFSVITQNAPMKE
jgi:hypothetical protein